MVAPTHPQQGASERWHDASGYAGGQVCVLCVPSTAPTLNVRPCPLLTIKRVTVRQAGGINGQDRADKEIVRFEWN